MRRVCGFRVPHSPQRFADGFGLVIERERQPDELDGRRPCAPSLCCLHLAAAAAAAVYVPDMLCHHLLSFGMSGGCCAAGLRWYVDFASPSAESVLWERYFHCADLGRDLVPVVQSYHVRRCAPPSRRVVLPHRSCAGWTVV